MKFDLILCVSPLLALAAALRLVITLRTSTERSQREKFIPARAGLLNRENKGQNSKNSL